MKRRISQLAVASFLLAAPRYAYADMVWPALLLEGRIVTWWAIAIGLLAEWPVMAWLLSSSWRRGLVATLVANLTSTLLGLVLIPLAGVAWEFFPGIVLYKVFNVGTFNPGTWVVTVVGAAAINAAIEMLVLRRFGMSLSRRAYVWLVAINMVSVGVAMASVIIAPPQT